MKKNLCRLLGAPLASLMLAGAAGAQAFPTKPIMFVVPFAMGGITDTIARAVGSEMEKGLGRPIVLEARPGASGTIAAKSVINSPPDGYTLYFGPTLQLVPIFSLNNSVDVSKDMVSVSHVYGVPFYFITSAKLPVKTFQQLLAYGKANPGAFKYGTSSTFQNLLYDMIKDRTGLQSEAIPYKGSAPIATALLAGDIQSTFGGVTAFSQHVQSGALNALFVTGTSRTREHPNVPTAAEAGLVNFDQNVADNGLWAPPGTPNAVVQRLGREAAAAVKVPALQDFIRKSGAEPVGSTPEEQSRAIEVAFKFWADAAKKANFKAQ